MTMPAWMYRDRTTLENIDGLLEAGGVPVTAGGPVVQVRVVLVAADDGAGRDDAVEAGEAGLPGQRAQRVRADQVGRVAERVGPVGSAGADPLVAGAAAEPGRHVDRRVAELVAQ